jgi:hypothetical protein
LLLPEETAFHTRSAIGRRERLGGLLSYYGLACILCQKGKANVRVPCTMARPGRAAVHRGKPAEMVEDANRPIAVSESVLVESFEAGRELAADPVTEQAGQ